MGTAILEPDEKIGYGAAPESDTEERAWIKEHGPFGHFIDGKIVKPVGRHCYIPVEFPATKEVLTRVAVGGKKEVDAAYRAAKKAANAWVSLDPFDRAKYLYAIARTLKRQARRFEVLTVLEKGKRFGDAKIDVALAVAFFEQHADFASIFYDTYPKRVPYEVIGAIIPFNFPLLMAAWKIAPALAAGATIVVKPDESTPLTAMALAEIFQQVGLPKGVVNFVNGGPETGQLMVGHPIPKKIAFTGSTEVGRLIRLATAGSGKTLTMELGGKGPLVAAKDACLRTLAQAIVDNMIFNQAEVCCTQTRVLAHASIYTKLIEMVKRRLEKIRIGDPRDKAVDMGPVAKKAQFFKINGLIEKGKAEGGTCWQPSCECPTNGWFIRPTIFTDVSPASTLAQVEIFGPVAAFIPWTDYDELVNLANNTPYGLSASVWTQNIAVMHDIASRIKAGTVWGNCNKEFHGTVPFGGVKESGFGKEGGWQGMLDVTHEDYKRFIPAKRFVHPTVRGAAMNGNGGIGIDQTYRALIGGGLKRPDGERVFQVFSADGKRMGEVGDDNRKDTRDMVRPASEAHSKWWRDKTAHNRGQIMRYLGENIDEEFDLYVRLIVEETGCKYTNARHEVALSIERMWWFAAQGTSFEGTAPKMPGPYYTTVTPEPFGVIGIRTPDEWPLLGLVNTIAPAIAMGNTVVVVAGKHPMTAMRLIRTLQHSELPGGVINIVTSKNPDAAAERFAAHKGVGAVWHWGSKKASKAIEAASVVNMKPTWVSNGEQFDWCVQGKSMDFIHHAIWWKSTIIRTKV